MSLLLRIHNITASPTGGLTRDDGTSDYIVWVGINTRTIWEGQIMGHVRTEGAAKLLRLIAEKMEQEKDHG